MAGSQMFLFDCQDSLVKPLRLDRIALSVIQGGKILQSRGNCIVVDVAILQSIGQWMKLNGESIRGTIRTPLPVQAWGESTRKGNTLYLHVFAWPGDGRLTVGGLKSKVTRAYLLSGAKRAVLPVERLNPLDLRLTVPAVAPDKANSVVVVESEEEIAADKTRLLLPTVESDTLRVFDAELRGKSLRFGAGKTRDAYVENWSKQNDFVAWPVRLNDPEVG